MVTGGEGMTIPPLANYTPSAQYTPTLAELFDGREDWWQWYAIDADGRGNFYEKEPFIDGVRWGWDGGSVFGWKHDITDVDWQTCIFCRPIEPTENDIKAFAMVKRMAQEIGGILYVRGRL